MSTLKDIASNIDPRFGAGHTVVWYMRPEFFRDGIMGPDFLTGQNKLPKVNDLGKTHKPVGCVDVRITDEKVQEDLDVVFGLMQGESWSPNGEARALIQSLGLQHTSMSVGDIIQRSTDGACYMVEGCGFRRL